MKFIPTAIALLLALNSYAQQGEVAKAKELVDAKKYEEAKAIIDQAVLDKKSSTDAYAWHVRGLVYSGLEDYLIASQSYEKALGLQSKKIEQGSIKMSYEFTANQCLNGGVLAFNEKRYNDARQLFEQAVVVGEYFHKIDTLAIMNVGLACERMKEYDCAYKQYRRCADLGYRGAAMYSILQYVLGAAGKSDEAIKVVEEGRAMYPEDADLLLTQLNYILRSGDDEKAMELLNTAIKQTPDNAILYFSRATIGQSLGMTIAEIEKDYNKALELAPGHFDSYYNMGVFYVNLAVEETNKGVDASDNEVYAQHKAQAKIYNEKAIDPLEKARALEPNNTNVLEALRVLYATVGMNEKYEEVTEKLKELRGE